MRYLMAVALAAAICAAGCSSRRGPGAGWVKLASGLEYRDVKVGSGPAAKDGDYLTVNYKGWLSDGTLFDSSMKPGGRPLGFKLGAGEVIPGWDQGLKGMKAGGTRELRVPPGLGYGNEEQPGIPANSTLLFSVELLKIGS